MVIRVRGTRTTGAEIPRLLLLLVITGMGWMIIGTGLLIGGLIWGLNSHQVSYQNSQTDASYHIGSGTQTGNIYINADGSSDYFVAVSGDFNPPISQSAITNSASISFVARTDTTGVDLQLSDGTVISAAHPIEKLVFYDKNGNIIASYTTAEYLANPNGYTINNWPYASLLIGAGVLCIGGGFFFILRRRQRQKQDRAAQLAALEAAPSPFARELGEG